MRQTLSVCRCSSTDWLGWKGGSNQNQRSAGKVGLHHDVGDEEAVLEDLALDLQPHQFADRAAGAVGDDQPVGFDAVGSVRRLDRQADLIGHALHRHDRFFQRMSMPSSTQRSTRYCSR